MVKGAFEQFENSFLVFRINLPSPMKVKANICEAGSFFLSS